MKISKLIILPLLGFTFSSTAALKVTDNFSISGFGSTSIAKSDNSTPLFVHREITDNTCYDCDTTFGLQGDLSIVDELNASLQVVKRPQDEWSSPEVEWAYLAYQHDDFTFKGGRLRIPLFLVSEYYYVGQAYHWARPPQEVYDSILGFTHYDGLSVSWGMDLSDEAAVTVSPYYAFENDYKTELGNEKLIFETDRVAGVSIDLNGFNYRVHLGYMHAKFSTLPANALSENIINLYTLGGEYSLNDWQFMAEVQTDNIQSNWYVSGAYHFDKFTPYLVYGESHHRRKTNSVTAGLRYDITYSISINAEWQGVYMTSSDYDKFQTGQFVIPPKLTGEDKDAQLYTLMLSFVF
ncbi:porin [Photobacterium sp. SDRW27]|uniref:porin n=1 Tax=Photobacterium obscurum TaxID=2829490 RepID=UPI0022430285|nr:porin [Photobacterium obscurum]MCW8330215.1 porin [Photobacterium obscurum]